MLSEDFICWGGFSLVILLSHAVSAFNGLNTQLRCLLTRALYEQMMCRTARMREETRCCAPLL
jgi:hypothetical protein